MTGARVFVRTRVAAAAVTVVAGVVLVAQPASAASHAGDLQVKGPGGSAYTQGPYVSQVGAVGAILSYTIQVVNTGTSLAQFRLRVIDLAPGTPAELYEGTLLLKPLASSPDGYYTHAIPAGGSQALTAKVKIPPGTATSFEYVSDIYLYATDGASLDSVRLISEEAAPAAGQTAYDVYAKSGSQQNVGGGRNNQVATAGTITPTGTATFTATLKNSGTTPTRIFLQLVAVFSCSNFVVTVTDGFTNVTAAAFGGTYQTPLLGAGAKRNLTITVKAAGTSCGYAYWRILSGPQAQPGNLNAYALVNLVA